MNTEGGEGQVFGFLRPDATSQEARQQAPRRVSFFDGDVVAAAPRGYCVAPDSVERGREGGFAILAKCENLTGQPGPPVDAVVMTVSVLPARAEVTQPRAATLGRSMSPVRVLDEFDRDGLAVVHLASGGHEVLPEGDPRYWRGAMVVNGHLTGLAVYAPEGSDAAGDKGRRLILSLGRHLRNASPDRPPAQTDRAAAGTEERPEDETRRRRPAGLGGLLRGLFGGEG
ncbi:hypothetical protein [Roseovarius salinarum]|uniref:hypothetical protein n=1 Tax=Roseovarius salinarum TaxID=1981892 RepID=UPI000C34CA44|nr:hypothetical protein [Roseovarius salinarum]